MANELPLGQLSELFTTALFPDVAQSAVHVPDLDSVGLTGMKHSGLIALTVALTFCSSANASVVFYLTQPSFQTATPTTLLEDFESFAPKDTALPSFTSNGVTYTGFAGAPFGNVWDASPGYNNFGAGVGTTTTSILTANGDEDFTMDFSSPYRAVGFDGYLNGSGPVAIQIFDISGLIFTLTDLRNLDNKEFYGFISDTPITSIRWTTTNGGQLNTGVDNILVGTAVPEPSTLALIGMALLSVSGFGV